MTRVNVEVIPEDKISDNVGSPEEVQPEDYQKPSKEADFLRDFKAEDIGKDEEPEEEPSDEELQKQIDEAKPAPPETETLKKQLEEFQESNSAAFARLKMTLKAAGLETDDYTDMETLVQDLENRVLEARRQSGDVPSPRLQESSVSPSLDELMQRHENEEIGMKFTPELRKFYNDFASKVTEGAQRQLRTMEKLTELNLAQSWYVRAKAEHDGDDPIPSFAEAYRLLQIRPELAQRALDRMNVFGDVSINPMETVFDTWRGIRTPSGLTKAEKAKRDADAQKLARLRKLEKAVPERAAPKSRKAQEEEMRSILENTTLSELG